VVLKVLRGERPKWPDDVPFFGYTEIVWRLAEECWDQDRNKRPSIHEVLDRLNMANMARCSCLWLILTLILGYQHIDVDFESVPWRSMNDHSLVNLLLYPGGLHSVLKLTGEDAVFVVNILDRVNFVRLSKIVIPNEYTRL
jgi:hypothetical protein